MTLAAHAASPPTSPSPSPTSRTTSQTPLHLDLSSLPPLITPSPPSNTLLITNLNNPATFLPQNLLHIRTLLDSPTPLNSFSPLRTLRRIIVSYPTTAAAIHARQLLDASSSPLASDVYPRIYFGEPTPLFSDTQDRHLHPPSLGKLLFISPPPSPPCGWEIRVEDPPNKDTHAEDLQRALSGLEGSGGGRRADEEEEEKNDDDDDEDGVGRAGEGLDWKGRNRSGSTTVVYHPRDHGDRADLPAVMVEDTTGEGGEAGEEGGGRMLTHTARPPVELIRE